MSGENKDVSPPSQCTSNPTKSIDPNSIYNKLSLSSRNLARNISSMGFPLEQVARLTEKLGKDDKKVTDYEHSIENNCLNSRSFSICR